MAKSLVRKKLLLNSAITLGMVAFAAVPNAHAATVTITSNQTTALIGGGNDFDSGDQIEVLAGANDGDRGNLAVTNGTAIDLDGSTGVNVYVETITGKGIDSTGAAISTILVDGTSTLNQLVVEAGTVSGSSTSANGGQAVVNLSGASAATSVTTGTNGIIVNNAGGTTILVDGVNDIDLTLNNAGNINGSGANAIGVHLSGGAGSVASVVNTGDITITGGTAFSVDADNILNLDNSGDIVGAIVASGSGLVNISSNTGTITGNITTNSGALTLNQSGSGKVTGNVATTSGDADINIAGTSSITGNVNLGSNASSTLIVGGTSNVGGNVTLGNAGQTLTLNGGTVTGSITGTGNVAVNQNYTLTDTLNITGTATIAAGKTLNADTNDENVTATAIALAGAGSTVTVGSGTFAAAVTATVNGEGVVNFNDDRTLTAAIGTNGNRVDQVNLGSDVDVNAGANGIFTDALVIGTDGSLTTTGIVTATNSITLNNGAEFTTGAGAVTGNITMAEDTDLVLGAGGLVGTITANDPNADVVYAATQATGGNITGVNDLTVNNGATLTANHNISADNVIVGNGASGVLNVAAGKTVTADDVTLNTGSTLSVDTTGSTAAVSGDINGGGTLAITGTGTFTQDGTIGATTAGNITVANGSTLTLNDVVNAGTITVGTGASGVLNANAGTELAADIVLDAGSAFNLNVSDFTGDVTGQANNEGTLNIGANYANGANNIGAVGNALNTVNVLAGNTLTLGTGTLVATNINVNGNGSGLDLGNTARTITGAVSFADAGTSTLDLGTADHTITGTLALGAGDTLVVGVNSNVPTGSGSITTTGAANSAAGGKLNVELASNSGRIDNGSYTIINGAGGALNSILASNIKVNGGTNSTGILTFTTATANAGEDLLLTVTRTDFSDVTTTENADNVGDALDAIGNANADTGALTTVLTALDNVNTAAAAQAILDQLTPQADNSITEGTYRTVGQSLNIVQSRMEQIRRGDNGVASGETVGDRGVWTEVFGSTADQSGSGGANGYDADTYGISVGGDKQINNRTRVGVSASYANTDIDSKGLNKTTDADTYQVNVYGTREFGKFYADGTLGFAWNEYESERSITVVPSVAKAEFDGQTYLARLGGGYKHTFNNGIDITPSVYLTYAHLETSDYSEKGAGALNLDVDNDSIDVLEPRVGVAVGKTFARTNMKVRPEVRVSYGYDLIGDSQVTTSSFSGVGPSFKTTGADVEQGSLAVGGGIDLISKNNLTVSADYDYETKSDFDAHTGLLRVRYDF